MTADSHRNALIRAYTIDMGHNYGNVVVAEVLRRRVAFHVHTKPGQQFDTSGAVLIDATDALGPLGQVISASGTQANILMVIRATDELLWLPTKAELGITDYWTIEMVPWIEYLRAASLSDEEVIRRAHQP